MIRHSPFVWPMMLCLLIACTSRLGYYALVCRFSVLRVVILNRHIHIFCVWHKNNKLSQAVLCVLRSSKLGILLSSEQIYFHFRQPYLLMAAGVFNPPCGFSRWVEMIALFPYELRRALIADEPTTSLMSSTHNNFPPVASLAGSK